MAIIAISRGSYGRGKQIAEGVAEELGYECVSRGSIVESINEIDTRAAKLIDAIEDIPSLFNRFKFGKDSYVGCFQAALLSHLRKDNVVYHGFMGHIFLKDIPHILKVRITSDIEDRTGLVMERDQVSKEEAMDLIKRMDEQRKKWSQYLYGVDPSECNQYDLVLSVSQIPVQTAVETIIQISRLKEFELTAESISAIENITVAAQVRNALLPFGSKADVAVADGKLSIGLDIPMHRRSTILSTIEQLTETMPTIEETNVQFSVSLPLSAEKVEEGHVLGRH